MKIRPYVIFSLVSLFIAIVLSNILNFSLTNSWQASIVLLFVFGPLWLFGWKKIDTIHKKPVIFSCLKFCLVLVLLGYLLGVLLFLFIGW